MLPKMDFDCIANSKTFSHGNTVCKYQLFFKLLHIFIKIIPFKSCPIFYRTLTQDSVEASVGLPPSSANYSYPQNDWAASGKCVWTMYNDVFAQNPMHL